MRTLYGDWRDIFACFGMALLSPRKLFIGLLGIITSFIGVFFISLFLVALLKVDGCNGYDLLMSVIHMLGHLDLDITIKLLLLIVAMIHELVAMFGCGGLLIYGLFLFPWLWMIACYYGAIISRIVAIDIAKNTSISTAEAVQFVKQKSRAYFWPPITLLIAIIACCGVLILLAYMTRLPGFAGSIFKVINGLAYPVSLFFAAVAFVLMIGGGLGWIFMIPAISVEGTDPFDALTRSLSYVFRSPIRYICNTFVFVSFGIVSWLLVMLIAYGIINLSLFLFHISLPAENYEYLTAVISLNLDVMLSQLNGSEQQFGAVDTFMARAVFVCIVSMFMTFASYIYSYAFTGMTMLYYLQRLAKDRIPMTKVFLPVEIDNTNSPAEKK